MSFFYYLRKLTSFTHGWLLSLRLCSYFFPICGSECVLLLLLLLLVCLCCYRICFGCCLRGVLKGRGCFDEEFLSALFSLTRKRGRSLSELKRLVWGFQRRNKVAVFERGARWGRSLLARWWRDDCSGCVLCFLFCGCCLGETGIFYQEEKVCLCVCFLCVFFLLRVQ